VIGGYIFDHENTGVAHRLNEALGTSYHRIPCASTGFLFHDNPFSDFKTAWCSSNNLTILSQDLLVTCDSDENYSLLDLRADLSEMFLRKKEEAFKEIVSDYRLIVVERVQNDTNLYLVSNRAGNGRIYYHLTESGILFCSDIRFLLRVVPFEENDIGVYAILKYGAIPEPLTISKNIAAVPPAHYLQYSVGNGICRTKSYFQLEFPCDRNQGAAHDHDAIIQPAKHKLQRSAQFLRKHGPAILLSGGIDSSLYASYMHQIGDDRLHGIHCTFEDDDPELPFAQLLAEKINAHFHVGRMKREDALPILNDTVALTGHPFSDFSSLPIVFILKFMNDHVRETGMIIEGNGGDDCFGFPDIGSRSKMLVKSHFPKICKDAVAHLFKNSKSWKWESHQGLASRMLALADVHEKNLPNYFLVLAPVNFLGLNTCPGWDRKLEDIMEGVFASCGKENHALSYEAEVTIRQLMHVNSRRWAAKAFSVGESLGIRCVYPYIWRDILMVQGTIPWEAKIKNGVVKWPLKRLLEEFMPSDFIYRPKSGFVPPFVRWLSFRDFNETAREILLSSKGAVGHIIPSRIIDELLQDALQGRSQRHAILSFLWGALFTEMWIQKYKAVCANSMSKT
jgi:asparagine synthase (glutamine-hydrolysing)